ncbi:amino acid permease [Microbulbifer marinus]|uniref:Transporter, cation-chloride cotransporter (CCC) family n=1 Tax=Microbulbifer marinus TaxID=658218 RepID=A0A1H3VUV4_9GAMM|nr:amino acid permease [Microbulbifer marinus]SDZ77902.1 transporter, cation-chloride cotransporter (CCC) family [Microbulbifer marinus]
MNDDQDQAPTGEPGPEDQRVEPLESAGGAEGEAPKDVQQQVETHEAEQSKKFGTFAGVFTPTLLTILGVIMFLREGWVIGNAGLGGGILIILLSFAITAATALSMASFVTNIRVGPGGAFSMISQSLGLEAGGAIGVPLYVSQALAVVMYIFGFREGYLWAVEAWGLPELPSLAIDLIIFAVIFAITQISTGLAFKVQYVILAIIIGSLVSIGMAGLREPLDNPIVWWGEFPGSPENGFSGATFWIVFAVFFPASTGIMAGANMSSDLKNPRKSIPIGTLAAVGLSLVVYLALAYWLMRVATVDELTKNYTIMIDRAYWGPAVLGGLLAATFSSALASFVGAPRILEALGGHSIVPASAWIARRTKRGEPRNATFITALIVLAAVMLRELNAIAPMVAMIFLLTYATINLVVVTEESLRLISFRPLMRVPRIVPLFGLVGCLLAMFIINPTVSLVAIGVVVAIYFSLIKRRLTAPTGDVRSGLFTALAEWAAKQVIQSQGGAERAWKPNILMPVADPNRLRGAFEFVGELAYPMGSIKLLGIAPADRVEELETDLVDAQHAFTREGIFTSSTVLENDHFPDGVRTGMQALAGSFFRPNLLFLQLPKEKETHESLQQLIRDAGHQRMGVALLVRHDTAGLGRRKRINLWIPDQGPDWTMKMDFRELDLAILLAYRMMDSWKDAQLTVIAAVQQETDKGKAKRFLARLVDLARLPADTAAHVADGDFGRFASNAPKADLNVFPLPTELDADFLWSLRDATGSTCLFTQDSGDESALA